MPLYEYECTACHKRTEKIQKFSDPEITACPKCGGVLERLISAPAISFKGGGWFADGYGNAKPEAASSGSSEGGSAPSGDSGTAPSTGKAGDSGAAPAPSATPAAAPAASPAPAASKD